MSLRDDIIAAEGLRLKPYIDSVGRFTIGYGRCLETTGISKAEAEFLLDNDILRATKAAQLYPWFWELSEPRQDVIIEMVFNLGPEGFADFKKMIHALNNADFINAAKEMRDSYWYEQLPMRGERLARKMENG